MKNKLFFSVVAISILLIGCKKNNDKAGIVLLSQVVHTNGTTVDITNLKYDDQNRLIEYSNDVQQTSYKYIYDSADRLSKENYSSLKSGYSYEINYDYTTPGIVKRNATFINGSVSNSTTIITLNDKQHAVKKPLLNNSSGAYYLYTYDETGNIASQSLFTDANAATPSSKIVDTYDQKNGYFRNLKGNIHLSLPFNVNNLLTETVYDYRTPSSATIYVTNTIEYNSDGYPLKITSVQTPQSVSSITNINTLSYITK